MVFFMAGFFGFFNYSKAGPGVSKDAPRKRGFFLFFELFFRKFWKFIQVNMLYFIVSIPMLALLLFYTTFFLTPDLASFMGEAGEVSEADMTYVILTLNFTLTFLIWNIFGAGPATAGFSYILKNYADEEHAWVFSDFFEKFKKNFKQCAAMVLIDAVALFLGCVSLRFYLMPNGLGVWGTIMGTVTALVWIMFTTMHFYIYPMIVTFDLKLKDILKNALIFSQIKLPSNILILLLNLIIYIGFFILASVSPLAWLLIFLLVPSFVGFMNVFFAHSHIKKIMIPEKEKTESESTFND